MCVIISIIHAVLRLCKISLWDAAVQHSLFLAKMRFLIDLHVVAICQKLRCVNLPLVASNHCGWTSEFHFVAQSGFITAKTPAFIECSRPSSKLNDRFAPTWPPFDRPAVYIVTLCERTSSVWNILIAFAVRGTRGILSKFCSREMAWNYDL